MEKKKICKKGWDEFMSTTKEMKDFILEQFHLLEDVTARSMMGEFLLYYKGILFGGIYDGRVLVKKTSTNQNLGMSSEIPYKGAKPMFMIEDIENAENVRDIVLATIEGLPTKK